MGKAETVEIMSAGVRWRLQSAELARCLLGPQGLRLEEWLASGQAQLVKAGPHREIYRVCLPEIDFYLKYYPLHPRRAWLSRLLGVSKAQAEYERARSVAERQVPTIELLAVGEHRQGSYLLTRTLPETRSLWDYLEAVLPTLAPAEQARMRQQLARTLGRFLARMHEAGITQHDLHPGNLLLRLNGEESQLFLIDLHTVRVGTPLSWRASRANLVILNRWFILRSHHSDRLRFWRAYARARAEGIAPCCPPADRRLAVRDLEQRTVLSNLRFWRIRDHRCCGKNRAFRPLHEGDLVGHCVTDLGSAALAPLLADPDGPFRDKSAIVLKQSPTSAVVEMELADATGPRRVIYKRFPATHWRDPWTALVRPTPALRSYQLGHGLQLRCLPTPRPLAVWHRRRWGLPRDGYLLTEKVADARELQEAVTCLQELPPDERRRRLRQLIEQVARLVSTLHQRCLSHRDLKAANVLVSGLLAEKELPQLWLIDLVGVRRHSKVPRRRRAQNLARLNASFHHSPALTRTDRLRFLRIYLRWGLRGRLGWKRWWQQVEQATAAKVRRNQRNGRPLS